MLFVIDVGNTNLTLGLYKGPTLIRTWRLVTDRKASVAQLGKSLARLPGLPKALEGIMIASVVPPMDAVLRKACQKFLHHTPLFVTPRLSLGIINRYKRPSEVGADRLVNAVAVRTMTHKPAIVVDFGTATTVDCISAKGEYLGGAICPGIQMAGDALAERTAKLPRVIFTKAPKKAMGRTTKESLQSGLFWGYIGLVEGLLRQLKKEMAGSPVLIVTGGLAPVIGPHLSGVTRIAPELTLEGLRILWHQNKGRVR